jgi:uncharacterized cysteine cluster protein YcgN (CxxCxxCC family)
MFPLLPQDKHEALCRRCGMSCHSPILLGTKSVIIPELHCRFLAYDAEGKALCAVYEHRYEAAPWCKSAQEAFEMKGLAHDCPYTQGIEGYAGKYWATDQEHQDILPVLVAKLISQGLTIEHSPESAIKLLERDGCRWTYTLSQDGSRFVFRKTG